MKKVLIVIAILSFLPLTLSAQFKRQDKPVSIREELLKPVNSQFGLSILDPSKLSISHSFSMSYMSIGGRGVAQNVYLNTLRYQIAPPLMLAVQWGIQQFPYNSFGGNSPVFKDGFFLSGAVLKYKPSDKFEMSLEYSRVPNYYSPYYYNRMGFPRFQSIEQEGK